MQADNLHEAEGQGDNACYNDYDDVFEASSKFDSDSGSETGSVFERRITNFRQRYEAERSQAYIGRQAAIARAAGCLQGRP